MHLNNSIINSKDIDSLNILANYQQGEKSYLDIDSSGHVLSKYAQGEVGSITRASTSLWRSVSYVTGYSGNSNDIESLTQLFDRIVTDSKYDQKDYSDLIQPAIEGLENYRNFYKTHRPEAVSSIDKVIAQGNKVLKVMQNSTFESKSRIKGVLPRSPADMEASFIAPFREVKYTYADDTCVGVDYYSKKIEAFLEMREEEFSEEVVHAFNTIKQQLEKTKEFDRLSSIGNWSTDFRPKIEAELGKKIQGLKAFNHYHKETMITQVMDEIESLSHQDQMDIGVLLPVGWSAPQAGHFSPVGIRKDSDGLYVLSAVNAGGGALGEVDLYTDFKNSSAHFFMGEIPLASYGETVPKYGPYTEEEIKTLIPKMLKTNQQKFESVNEAVIQYEALFNSKRKMATENRGRRFQISGNCTTRQVLEWIVDIMEAKGMAKEVNAFMAFAQARDLKSPAMPLAEGSGNIDKGWVEVEGR